MNANDLKLNSVNWEHGMLLTPDHFIRQEHYTDSLVSWALRYTTDVYGLAGGGPRVRETERGAARFDPIVTLSEGQESLTLTVAQCRGITPSGSIVEVAPESPLEQRFAKAELEGVQEAAVYIVREEGVKDAAHGEPDEFNPQMQTERRYRYRISRPR